MNYLEFQFTDGEMVWFLTKLGYVIKNKTSVESFMGTHTEVDILIAYKLGEVPDTQDYYLLNKKYGISNVFRTEMKKKLLSL